MNNLKKVLEEDRLIRNEYADTDEHGRQLLCALTALTGDPSTRPVTCPAEYAPAWVAHLLPWMDDAGTEERWPEHMRRLAELAPKLPHLSTECEYRCRAIAVREAMRHTTDGEALSVCEAVATLCERRGKGEEVPDAVFATAQDGAETAAWKAARAAAEAAETAARAAVRAAVRAERAAEAEAAWSWAAAPRAAAADRIIAAMLTEMESD